MRSPLSAITDLPTLCGAAHRYRWRKILQQAKAKAAFEERCRYAPNSLLDKTRDSSHEVSSRAAALPSRAAAPSRSAPANGLSSAELRKATGTTAQSRSADPNGRGRGKSATSLSAERVVTHRAVTKVKRAGCSFLKALTRYFTVYDLPISAALHRRRTSGHL